MTASLLIPEVLYSQVVTIARQQNLPPDEFMLLAIAEKLALIEHQEWLKGDAKPGTPDPCGGDA